MNLFLIFSISLILSNIFTRFTIQLFHHFNWVEDPLIKNKKTGNATALYPVPRGGGVPIFTTLVLLSLATLPLDNQLIAILISSLIATIVGLIDDIHDISPFVRLGFNLICGFIIVSSGISIYHLSNPLGGQPFDFSQSNILSLSAGIGSVLWIAWCMNAIGWSAGVEGQLPFLASISSFFIGLLALKFSQDLTQWPVIILALIVSGAFAGFLPLNFYPQKIMPGYSGKSLAGLLLSVLSILSGAKLATLLYLLSIPMLDAIFVIVYRLYRHKSPFLSDSTHLHHRLLKMGWSRRQISLFYGCLSMAFGIVSLYLDSRQKMYGSFFILLIFSGVTLWTFRRTSR